MSERMFDLRCPYCGSVEWESEKKDANGINEEIRCLQCRIVRERRQEPIESIQ